MSDEKPRALFAEFAVRMAAVAVDMLVALFAARALHDHVLYKIGVTYTDHRPTVLIFLFVYFAASWLSPMRATPTQFLLGMRVISDTGEKLGVGRVVARAALLVGLIEAALAVFRPPVAAYVLLIGLVAYASLIIAIFNRKRQAGHDLLLHSMVVNRRTAVRWRYDEPREFSRPAIISIIGNSVLFAIPIFTLSTFGLVDYTKNLRSRVAYAYSETRNLRAAIEEYHFEFDRFPIDEDELGLGSRSHYPEGGYYELETGGAIRVRFTVLKDLKNGSLVFLPEMTSDGIEWSCTRKGELHPKFMPAFCRD